MPNNNYNYGYDKLVILNGETITNRLKGDIYAAGGKYHKQYKSFDLEGEIGINITGDFDGNFIKGIASFKLNEDISATAQINHSSKAPNYNVLLFQSDYINYNWQNNFNNIETQQLAFHLKSKKIANVFVDYSTITDYAYFKKDETSNLTKAFQNNTTITYLRVKLEKEIRVGKFALNNSQNPSVLVLPQTAVLSYPHFRLSVKSLILLLWRANLLCRLVDPLDSGKGKRKS